ncbi:MAG: hypothetical protein ACFB6R_05645 [Alphaproteobacteria bacterium]
MTATALHTHEPAFPAIARSARAWTALLVLLAALAQTMVLALGLVSVSADESARALMAHAVTPETALEPFIWPPFYKIAVGAGLYLYDDLFLTPRVIAFFMGLVTLGAILYLAHRLFEDRVTTVIAGALGVFLSHRVIFGAAPQSEMFFNVFVLMAFAFFAGWLVRRRPRDTLLASALFALACLVRFEAWFMAALYGLFLAYAWAFERRLSFGLLALNGMIVSSAPLLVLGQAWLSYGSLEPLFITGVQAKMFGASMSDLLFNSHAFNTARDVLSSPLILALVPLTLLAVEDPAKRRWILCLIGSLVVITLATFATRSVAYAAPWRLSGVWTMAVVPFAAVALISLVRSFVPRFFGPFGRSGALAGLCAAAMLAFALDTLEIVRSFNGQFSPEERQTGAFIRQALDGRDGNVLLAADSFDFLDVIVASNRPDRFVINRGEDPLQVGLYVGFDDFWRREDPAIYEAHVAPKFDLDRGGDAEQLAARNIFLVVSANPAHHTALDANSMARLAARFGPWSVYTWQP